MAEKTYRVLDEEGEVIATGLSYEEAHKAVSKVNKQASEMVEKGLLDWFGLFRIEEERDES